MDLSNLKPAKGSTKNKKRVGRGPGSTFGRTAGRGNNGYGSRSGSTSKIHYEGGQTPLMRRLPKRGFTNYPFKKEVQVVNVDIIAALNMDKIDVNTLIENGIVKKAHLPVKILGNGDIDKAVEIKADMFSASAIKKIENAGGKAIYL
jgi:large subunit ribosomal protein L15|tara:strand:+ start:363 stop:803 length:441 start_codon:yes stop_codon:yes gene_type:complete